MPPILQISERNEFRWLLNKHRNEIGCIYLRTSKLNSIVKALILTTLVVLLSSSFTLGQSQLLEGYLVTSAKDTLRGYIQDTKNNWRVKSIRFASSLSSAPSEYLLESFSGLYIKPYDEYYFVRKLEIDKKPIRLNELESFPARKIVEETVLTKLLARGRINLFFYLDENNKSHFFFQKDGGKIEELSLVKYYTAGGGLAEFPFYIETLKNATADCEKVRISNPALEETPLKKIIEKYNTCFSEETYVKKKEKAKLAIGIVVGTKYSDFKYQGIDYLTVRLNSTDGAAQANFDSGPNVFGGINMDILSKKSTNPFAGNVQILWQQTRDYQAEIVSYSPSSNITSSRNYTAQFSYLSAQFGVKYFFLKQKLFPLHLRAGLGYNHIISNKQQVVVTDLATMSSTKRDFMNFRNAGLLFTLGAGISYKKIFLELFYQRDQFYGAENSTVATMNGVSASLGFKLFN